MLAALLIVLLTYVNQDTFASFLFFVNSKTNIHFFFVFFVFFYRNFYCKSPRVTPHACADSAAEA